MFFESKGVYIFLKKTSMLKWSFYLVNKLSEENYSKRFTNERADVTPCLVIFRANEASQILSRGEVHMHMHVASSM